MLHKVPRWLLHLLLVGLLHPQNNQHNPNHSLTLATTPNPHPFHSAFFYLCIPFAIEVTLLLHPPWSSHATEWRRESWSWSCRVDSFHSENCGGWSGWKRRAKLFHADFAINQPESVFVQNQRTNNCFLTFVHKEGTTPPPTTAIAPDADTLSGPTAASSSRRRRSGWGWSRIWAPTKRSNSSYDDEWRAGSQAVDDWVGFGRLVLPAPPYLANYKVLCPQPFR